MYSVSALTPVETCTHTFGVSLAIAAIDFPSCENAYNADHLEKLKGQFKSRSSSSFLVQLRKLNNRES